VTVYALSSSANSNMVRYIGQTSRKLSERLSKHKCTTAGTPVANWIRGEIEKGHSIVIQVLEKKALPGEAEMRWIALFEASGAQLLNCKGIGQNGAPPRKLRNAVQTQIAVAPAAAWPFPSPRRRSERP